MVPGDSITLFELARDNVLLKNEPRSQFFISILGPIIQLSGGSYWITSLWLSLISFMASWYGVKVMAFIFPDIKYPIAFCLLFIPTVVFWSSGILKDSLTFAAFTIATTLVIKFYKNLMPSLFDLLLLAISMFLLFKIKHYLFIMQLIFGGLLVASVMLKKIKGNWKWIATLIFLSLTFFATQKIHPYLEVDRIAWTLYQNNKAVLQKTDDPINLIIENPTWSSVIKEIPKALHTGLFRPSVFDSVPLWGLLHQVENLILSILLFFSLLLLIKQKPKVDGWLVLASIACIFLLAILLPLSTPNFGSLVRYKNAYMPFLFLICSILPYQYLTSKSQD